jgi:hypothetical protein
MVGIADLDVARLIITYLTVVDGYHYVGMLDTW